MLNFLWSWYGLLLGGGLTTFILLVVALKWAGVSAQPVFDLIGPLFKTVGEKLADFVGRFYDNMRDGYRSMTPKGWFALVVTCAFVAGLVYIPTKQRAEQRGAEKQVRELRKSFRFVPKKKATAKQWIPAPFTYGAK